MQVKQLQRWFKKKSITISHFQMHIQFHTNEGYKVNAACSYTYVSTKDVNEGIYINLSDVQIYVDIWYILQNCR
jgi:hypothetical protein